MKKILKNRLSIILIAALLTLSVWLLNHYQFVINHSESLPLKVVLIEKKKLPSSVDDIFVFFVRNNPTYNNREVRFIKLLGGKEGDIVFTGKKRDVYVGDKFIGMAKTISLKGLPLSVISQGAIPAHKFFAYTPHHDSFDSRYKEIGLIDENDIIGTAIFVW